MDDNERKYIELKLKGCIDDKQKLANEYKIDKSSIATISEKVQELEGISSEEYAKFQDDHNAKIQTIKSLCTEEREKGFKDIVNFYDWYIKYDKVGTCCYCGINKNYLNVDSIFNNSKRGRGKNLEVERVVTFPNEKNVYSPDNCRLACHICNNAKSDFLSVKDFKPIAKGINNFWNMKLKDKDITVDFPTAIYEQFKL